MGLYARRRHTINIKYHQAGLAERRALASGPAAIALSPRNCSLGCSASVSNSNNLEVQLERLGSIGVVASVWSRRNSVLLVVRFVVEKIERKNNGAESRGSTVLESAKRSQARSQVALNIVPYNLMIAN